MASSVLTGVTRCFGVDGLIAAVPGLARKEQDAGFFGQTPPVRAEFLEQNGTQHYIAVFTTLALDVNHHPSAIDVAHLQASQLRVPNTGGVESHE